MSNKNKAINGAKWTSVSTAINAILQFGQVTVLARMLQPSAFGIVAISTLIINFLGIFAHFGFSNSIIYKQETDQKTLSTIFFLNQIIGVSMFILMYLCTPLLVWYYKSPELAGVLHISAFTFPIVFLGQIYNILLEKELKFKQIAITDIICVLLGTSVTIAMAYNGFEEKSLVVGLLVQQFVKMLIQNYLGRQYFSPVLHFKLKEIKEHLVFGIYNIGDNVVGFINTNIDNILIGGFLGVKDLGYYTIATQIAVFPIVRLCPIIIQTSFPIMAKIKDSTEDLKRAYLKILDFITFCMIPLLVGLFLTADNVIPLFYGPGWSATVPLVRIFVVMGILSCMIYPSSPVAFLMGKPNMMFYRSLIILAIRAPFIYIIARYFGGLYYIAAAFMITTLFSLVLNMQMIYKLVGNFFGTFFKNLAMPFLFSLAMTVVILLYKRFVGNDGVVNTVAQIVLGGLVYIGLTLKFKLSFSEIKNLKGSL